MNNNRLHIEKSWIKIYLVLWVLIVLSGALNSLSDFILPAWLQINIVAHSVIGIILVIPAVFYVFNHFKRTSGIKRPFLIFTGLVISLLLLGLFSSGIWISINGQTRIYKWVDSIHSIFAYIAIALVVLHILAHRLQKDTTGSKKKLLTIDTSNFKYLYYPAILFLAFLLLTHFSYTLFQSSASEPDNKAKIDSYEYAYGSHPFSPSETETASGSFIRTEEIAKSEQCGTCHQDIFNQWASSTHRHAASDPAYVKNINLLESKQGISATRYCEGCHAPVALLTGELTPGGKHGGIPDTPAHIEGVGCMGCHGIVDVKHTNGTASYIYEAKTEYLFEHATHPIPQRIRNMIIRLHPTQHKEMMGNEIINDPKLCASCHEQFMDKSMNNWGWVKMQSEYTNWLQSPFSGQNQENERHSSVYRCQDCHFEKVPGNDPASSTGMISSHRSLGANTILPLLAGDSEQLEATKRFLQSAKLRVNIEKPNRNDTLYSRQHIDQSARPNNNDNTPYFLYLTEDANIRVVVSNQFVGHSFPAGTTDLNQAWVHFEIKDASNSLVYENGFLAENLELDKNAHVYKTIPVDRNGKEIWKHDLFRMIGESYRNVIESGESDIVEYNFKVPSWAKSPLSVTATLRYRKFNQRYANWVFEGAVPVIPIIDMATDTITIPLKTKPITSAVKKPTASYQ